MAGPIAPLKRALRALLVGPIFGDLFPQQPDPPPRPRPVDARTGALRALKIYLEGIVFYCVNKDGEPAIPFQILEENILIKPPEGEHVQKYPSIVVVGGEANYEAASFTPVVFEETWGQYAPGTALVRQSTYAENLVLDLWASTEPELRALIEGLETAFSPIDGRSGLLLYCADYYGLTGRFLLTGRTNTNDTDAARNRRRSQLKVTLDIDVVRLTRFAQLSPEATLSVGYDPQTGEVLDLSETPGASYVAPPDAIDAQQS
jgi:hypothetical protein